MGVEETEEELLEEELLDEELDEEAGEELELEVAEEMLGFDEALEIALELPELALEEAGVEEIEAGLEDTSVEETVLIEAGRDVASEERDARELERTLGLVQALKRKKSEPKRRARGLESEPFFIRDHPAAN